MSDIEKADTGTEFAEAWNEAADEQSQPDEGRTAEAPEGGQATGGPEGDADLPPAADDQTTDADLPPAGDDENSDELAGLPDHVRDRLKAAEDRAAKAENTLRSNEGRFSRAERELNELRLREQQRRQEQQQPGNDTGKQPVDIDAALEQVSTEYPDIGGPLTQVISGLRQKVEALESAGAQQATIEATREELATQEFLGRQQQLLTEKHSDWAEVVKTTEYAEWALKQPTHVQELIVRNGEQLVDGEAAADVLDRFKRDTKPEQQTGDPKEQQRRAQQLDGSRQVPSRTPAMEARERGGGDYDSEWAAAAEEDRRKASRRQ